MLKKNFNSIIRWLHLYLSMFGFAALFFFAFTGLTLNHPGWSEGKQKVKNFSGVINSSILNEDDPSHDAREKIIEHIRKTHKIKTKNVDFRVDDTEVSVSFTGPGYSANTFIDRSTGSYELTVVSAGFISVINDLHKGRDVGSAWTRIIDISAILMIVVSVTGFIMIFFICRRKKPRLIVAIVGALTFMLLCIIFT